MKNYGTVLKIFAVISNYLQGGTVIKWGIVVVVDSFWGGLICNFILILNCWYVTNLSLKFFGLTFSPFFNSSSVEMNATRAVTTQVVVL